MYLRVLVDVDDVDDVPAAARPPVHLDLAARLLIILQYFERELRPALLARAFQHLVVRENSSI